MRTLNPAAKNARPRRLRGSRNGARGLFHIDRSTRHRMLMNRQIYLMYLPAILTVIVFNLFTTYGLKIAWLDFNFQDGLNSPSIGWEYFRVLFGMPRFFRLMRNTVEITFLRLLFGFPVVILLALLLNDMRSKALKNASQSVLYLPHFLNWVIIATLLYMVFNEHSGVLSRLFGAVGLPYEDITWKREWIRVVLIGSGIWKTMGWSTIIYLAALSAVDPGLYENAIVDGAGKLTQMWHISVPCHLPGDRDFVRVRDHDDLHGEPHADPAARPQHAQRRGLRDLDLRLGPAQGKLRDGDRHGPVPDDVRDRPVVVRELPRQQDRV